MCSLEEPIPIILLEVRMLLSILIPVYNERTVVERSLSLVLTAPLPENMERELVIVDDCSTDGTSAILERLAAAIPADPLYPPPRESGKGRRRAHRDRKGHGRFLPDPGRRSGIRSRANIRGCCGRCWTATPTRSSARATWPASKRACCPSGTP